MTNRPTHPLINLEAVQAHFHQACRTREPVDLWHAVADVPALLAELSRTRSLLSLLRMTHANLLAAARATVAAAREGEPEPLFYLIDELSARNPMPPPTPGTGRTDREEDR